VYGNNLKERFCSMANLQTMVEKTTIPKAIISPKTTQSSDNQTITKAFWHLRTYRNCDYELGLKIVPLRSCLLHNNVNRILPQNQLLNHWVIKTKPKWKTDLLESHLDKESGELTDAGIYSTDDLTSGNYRKIKALNRFCDIFQPLYKKNKCSIFFLTLTLANQSTTDIRGFLNSYKTRLKRNGIKLMGSIWVLEISQNLHVHYHLLIATNRISIKGKSIPNFLKGNDLWGCRTQIEFAKKHIRNYLSKYFTKNQFRILQKRTYGVSISKEFN
jgi:hypothetical protein